MRASATRSTSSLPTQRRFRDIVGGRLTGGGGFWYKSGMKRISRRRIIRNVAAGSALVAMSKTTRAQTTKSSTTQVALPIEDLSAANRVLGHDFTGDEEKMMLGGMRGKRSVF